jgi:hypothetical protein
MSPTARDWVRPLVIEKLWHYWPVAVVLVMGLILSLLVFQFALSANRAAADVEMRSRIEQRHRAIEGALSTTKI